MTAEQRWNYICSLVREMEAGLVGDEEFTARAASVRATDEELETATKENHA